MRARPPYLTPLKHKMAALNHDLYIFNTPTLNYRGKALVRRPLTSPFFTYNWERKVRIKRLLRFLARRDGSAVRPICDCYLGSLPIQPSLLDFAIFQSIILAFSNYYRRGLSGIHLILHRSLVSRDSFLLTCLSIYMIVC